VSNFKASHIERLRAVTGVLPAVNQIQLSPALARTRLHEYLAAHDICTEAWSPLGQAGHVPANPVVTGLARRYGKTPGQIILRWQVQQGIVAIPKSADPARQAANLDVFGFELTAPDMRQLTGLDQGEDAARNSDIYEEF
jgi:2,5-diketo-D-gluconate reductase A